MAYATTQSQNLTNFDEALKIDYLPVIREQLNNARILSSKIERNERDVSGKQWQMTTHVGRSSGIGSGTESGLPTASNQEYLNPFGNVKYTRGRISLSGPVIAASKSDTGAMARALESEIKGITEDMKKEVNYQFFNDGSAVRALVYGEPGTDVTLTLDNPGTRWLQEGMLIDIFDPSAGTTRTLTSGSHVESIVSSSVVKVNTALASAVADNDWVIRKGARAGATALLTDSYEMMGLKGIIDDGTYVTTLENLSRTTYPHWNCSTNSTDSNAGTLRDITEELIQASLTSVEANGGKTNLIISDFAIRDAIVALIMADKRYVNTTKLTGGFTAFDYNGIQWVADGDCPANTVFFIDTDHLQIMQMSDWSWMDRDGAVLSRVADADAYEAVLYWYADLTTDKPKAHAFLRDVQ
jgi:hypothetical protein